MSNRADHPVGREDGEDEGDEDQKEESKEDFFPDFGPNRLSEPQGIGLIDPFPPQQPLELSLRSVPDREIHGPADHHGGEDQEKQDLKGESKLEPAGNQVVAPLLVVRGHQVVGLAV